MSFESLFFPRGVAVVGSMTPGKLGHVLLTKIIDGGYTGKLYAVNPKGVGAYDVKGYTSAALIDDVVDLAVVVTPPSSVVGVLDDCGKVGITSAVIITAGFSETGNHVGEQEVLAAAKRNNIRIVGPNCAGIVCTSHNLFPTLEVHPPKGSVALVSQSGALGGVVLAWAAEQGLGISKFVSYGNGNDISQAEFLRYFKDDPETKVIALYIESVKNGREFMEVLEECSRVKPVVIIKAGRTNVGHRATSSHTGSMAGEDGVYDAAFKQCGAIRVNTVAEMLDLCTGFSDVPEVRGNRVVIVTNSGGPGVLGADKGEEVGLNMAEVCPEALEQLKTFLPPQCGMHNPIDLTVEGTEDGYRKTLLTVLDGYDAAIAMNICPPYLDSTALAKGVIDAQKLSGKPIVANFLPNQVVKNSVDYLAENGIPNFVSGERAAQTLAWMSQYSLTKEKLERQGGFSEGWQALQKRLDGNTKALPADGQILEPDAMNLLKENGVAVPSFMFALDAAAAAAACQEIGFPCVMKVVSPQILHKSDVGGVIVGISTPEEARKAFETIATRAEGKDFRGVVIYPMVRGAKELIMGLASDPQFGSVVMVGLGGIYAEIFKDIAMRVAPVSKAEAMDMLLSIKSVKLLQGVRGEKAVDMDKLADTISHFSELPFVYPEIAEMDVNPLFVTEDGPKAGDVRIIRK